MNRRLSHLASLTLCCLALPALAACEPGDEGPPPATAQNAVGMSAAPTAPTQDESATAGAQDDGMYASGEYALGEDSDAYDDSDPSALTDFRATLDPYGTWVDDSTYGTVWVPSSSVVGTDFVPYTTAGHWVYDDDYVWVSDYEWGWAPFHYGRWVYIDGRGWAWIPGRDYAGAWVGWGWDPDYAYVGWYPLGPAFIWWGGVAVGYSFYWGPRWEYCARGDVFSPTVGARVVTGGAVGPVAARVTAQPAVSSLGGVPHGPEPKRLGYTAAQIPHATGTSAAAIAHAQQFSRPSTATALGAHAATRFGGSGYGAQGMRYGGALPPGIKPQQQGGKRKPPAAGYTPPARGRSFGRGGYHPSFGGAPAPVAPRPSFGGGGFHGGGGGGHGGGHH
ncbi:MAG TPA: DUF6600 domain-containing protein [Polyangiaceae bacterium]